MRYLIYFSYDGTLFHGFQKQDCKRTIEGELEKALFEINAHRYVKVCGAGRTDKGVHANCQCAHFDIDILITPYKLKCALNSFLPSDIHVFDVFKVPNDFHARYDVKRKTYRYKLNMGEYNPLERNYVYQLNRTLNFDKMEIAIKSFLGVHNFKCFVSNEVIKDNYVREIFDASIINCNNILTFTFTGTGFMKYQVRNMVGTLIKIGLGKIDVDYISKVLDGKEEPRYVLTAKPQGLYLDNIEY